MIVEHGHGYYTLYTHLEKDDVKYKVGEEVQNGDVIATSGNTGGSTSPHLHFEIIKSKSLYGDDGAFRKKKKLDPKSIKDLQLLLDKLNGKLSETKLVNPDNPVEIKEVEVTAKTPKKLETKEVKVQLESNTGYVSLFHKGRLYSGNHGYIGSYWQTYDKTKEWSKSKKRNKSK